MNPVVDKKLKNILFWLTSVVIAIHILVSSLYIFYSIDFLPDRVVSVYQKFIVLGPFFADDQITKSPHLYISHSTPTGCWLPFRDVSHENLQAFKKDPWRYNQLKLTYYHRYISREAYEAIHVLKYIDGSEGWASSELIRFGKQIQQPESDSIRFLLLWNEWMPLDEEVKIDTAFYVIFKAKRK